MSEIIFDSSLIEQRPVAVSLRNIPSLDGLRAVSILLVFVAHAGFEKYVPGGLGVTIFFFLSGFLITTLMREEYRSTGRLNLKHFWMRRALRILPPFYLVLVLASFAYPFGEGQVAQALHVTNYYLINHGNQGLSPGTVVYWSLSVEEHFYLLFPWVFLALQRFKPRDQAMILYGTCAVVLAWRFIVMTADPNRTYMGTDTRVDSILFGCALAMFNDRLKPIEKHWTWYSVGAMGVLGLCLIVRSEMFRETLRYTLQGIALTVLFVAAIRFDWWPTRILNNRALKVLGLLSYSFYLLHYCVIFAVQAIVPANHAVQGVIAFGVALGCSWLIYRLIERPCAQLRKRLHESKPVLILGEQS